MSHFFHPYPEASALPVFDPRIEDLSVRLSALQSVCFEILRVVSQNSRMGPLLPVIPVDGQGRQPEPVQPEVPSSRAVPIVPPVVPVLEEDDESISSSDSQLEDHDCTQCKRKCRGKWDLCNKCFRARKREVNTVLCSTESCNARISRQNKSGLCHVCWEEAHPKCLFCNGHVRKTERVRTCRACITRITSFQHSKDSRKSGWYTRGIQRDQIGRLYSRDGRFSPDLDQEASRRSWDELHDYLAIAAEDRTRGETEAHNRRITLQKKQDEKRDAAFDDFLAGREVEILPSVEERVDSKRRNRPLSKVKDTASLMHGKVPQDLLPQVPPPDAVIASAIVASTDLANESGLAKLPMGARKTNAAVAGAHFDIYQTVPVVSHPERLLPESEHDSDSLLSSQFPVSSGVQHKEAKLVKCSDCAKLTRNIGKCDACITLMEQRIRDAANKTPESIILPSVPPRPCSSTSSSSSEPNEFETIMGSAETQQAILTGAPSKAVPIVDPKTSKAVTFSTDQTDARKKCGMCQKFAFMDNDTPYCGPCLLSLKDEMSSGLLWFRRTTGSTVRRCVQCQTEAPLPTGGKLFKPLPIPYAEYSTTADGQGFLCLNCVEREQKKQYKSLEKEKEVLTSALCWRVTTELMDGRHSCGGCGANQMRCFDPTKLKASKIVYGSLRAKVGPGDGPADGPDCPLCVRCTQRDIQSL